MGTGYPSGQKCELTLDLEPGGGSNVERGFPHFSRYKPDLQNSASIRKLADSLCSGLLRRGFTLAELQPFLGSQLWWVSHLMCIEEAPMTSDERLLRTWERIAEEATHEQDPEKLMSLINELTRAIDARRQSSDDGKS